MNTEPLDELYLKWLYEHIGLTNSSNPARTHWKLAQHLLSTEFIWLIPNDDNRCEDGKELRYEFAEELGLFDIDPDWMEMGCSMLEMLIALSRRVAFYGEGAPSVWFWRMMKNLGLDKINDRVRFNRRVVDEAIERVMWRLYDSDGRGGLFPLRNPKQDQRDVELWYQMNAYLLENAA